MKFLERVLDKIDEKKREKALKTAPFLYIDRHGKRWFNTNYYCAYGVLRKIC